MGVADVARSGQAKVIARSDRATSAAVRLWRRVSPDDLDGSFGAVLPALEELADTTVRANAVTAAGVVAAAASADRMRGDVLVPDAFTGVDPSGRSMGGLFAGAVTTTKRGIAGGMSIPDAMLSGASYLALAFKSAVADMERSASMVGAVGRGYTQYVRLVNPGACSRCAILAGSDRFSTNFRRHPACRCATVPVRDGDEIPEGLFGSPDEYFASLSASEQERVFTKAGAEAIRLGADPVKVVDARRGMSRNRATPKIARIQKVGIGRDSSGATIYGYVTAEGATARAAWGRQQLALGTTRVRRAGARYSSVGRARLMPESIIELTDDPELRRVLLRDAGYTRPAIRDMSNNRWIAENQAMQIRDKAIADEFYRSKGIVTG